MDRRAMHTLTRTAAAVGAALIAATLISAPAQAASGCPPYYDARLQKTIYPIDGDYGIPYGPAGDIHVCRNGSWVKWR
ncbi:hypothetical protein [Streptosporangium sp. NPDC087985]|uniref:hypothetical protein n=1 Tax=Streptosporangium sp. NPDC087985 TaxID=3366196 RepID=UPI00382EFAA1